MKTHINNLFAHRAGAASSAWVLVALLAGVSQAAAQPVVTFTQPTNGQQIVTFRNLAGTAQKSASGPVQQVTFSIYDQATGQWWNGTNYQGAPVSLPASLAGANWAPAPGVALPAPCCGQYYQLTASATDTGNYTGTTNITVQADAVPPVAGFAPLADGQTVSDLSALGGSVTDNFGLVASVAISIHEQDINYGAGRWWNGTNFQGSPVTLPASLAGTTWAPAPGVMLPALNSGQSYDLTVIATDTTSNSASTTITVTEAMTVLGWDPGQTPLGTVVWQRPNTNGGSYWFKIIPQSPAVGVWRTALNVLGGQASVYLRQSSPPNIYGYSFGSANPNSNGFVVDASQFQPGQDWYILVNATPDAKWNLVTGDIYVYPLGALAADSSSSTNATLGAEGMIFYQTTVPSTTLAWQLWLNGAPNTMFVKKSAAPDPASYDLTQAGQMLVVPPYLASGTYNGTYFVGVAGSPGTLINLDSRQQPVADLAFSSLTNLTVTATNFPYVTYRVQVPVQQIAWQLNLLPSSGLPNIAVRRDLVPNEFRNDAFSETPTNVGASVTLVPPPPQSGSGTPGLSDGTFFVTVYSTGPFTCGFTNSNPVITDVHYVFSITNDAPTRAGWRYYRITTIAEQLGTLGWGLMLSNQVPGSEIAIRRNAVPGQWNQRTADDNYYVTQQGYVDLSSVYGLLQQPGHQADIWYIGVYTPNQALGAFTLTGFALTGQPVAFDGSLTAVTNQPPGQWGFYQVTVPADALGWDVRLVGVTQGNPQMVVSRDTLPSSLGSSYWWIWQTTSWPSGIQWLNTDWTGCATVPMLAAGMGNPLEAGTYYIGVQDPNNASSYTVQSRGIGLTNYAIRVKDLSFNGSTNNSSLAVTEGDYYRVVVPSNTPDWKLQLSATAGEVLLKVQRDYLPNSGWNWYDPYGAERSGYGGQLMMKPGNEQWALLPENDGSLTEGTNLTAGTYYVLVASQGQNLTNGNCNGYGSGWGTGSASYTLSSVGEPVTQLGGALSYGNDLVFTNGQQGGEMKFYQFNVPAGIASVEVRLENRVGNPVMLLNQGLALAGSAGNYPYGNFGGTNDPWSNGGLITVVNPSGPCSLSIYGADDGTGTYPDASYVLRVRAVPPPVVAFDGGTFAVTNQPAGEWQFYQVTVPADALGWDVRLVGVTQGNPQMVVSRDTLPSSLGSSYWWIWQTTSWPSGIQWLNTDWTGCATVPMLAAGMGNPLEAGTYYIGVQDPNNGSSYTVRSRGIGLTNYAIRVKDLSFNGSTNNPSLAVTEGDYYRVVVPSNAPDWKLQLSATAGEVLLKVQRDYLPNSGWNWYDSYGAERSGYGGQLMMKPGNEQWALLPENDGSLTEGTNLTAGTYYVLVASQGQNLTNGNCNGYGSGWGTGSASYTLSSVGEPVTQLAGALSYGNDLVFTNGQQGGEMKFYQFNVPAGIASVEVRLENRVGNPVMLLNQGLALAGSAGNYPYGNFGGTNDPWSNGSLITVVNPSGPCSLSIYGADDGTGTYPDASYVLRVRAVPPPVVAFDGGTFAVTNQPAGEWQFYQVTVPADALGWDVRLVGVTQGNPQLVVSRDTLPSSLGSSYWWIWQTTSWPSGIQWLNTDWTGCATVPMLAAGMGNPLEAGTYYIGVQDPNNASSYTVRSRGIGLTNYAIRVKDLSFNGSTNNSSLAVTEGDYYRVVVPSNTPDWKLQLSATAGEVLLKVQRDYLPNSGWNWYDSYGAERSGYGGQLMMKPGNEQWALLPENDGSLTEGTNLTAGTYYVLVASQGQNLTNGNCNGYGSGWGTGSASYTLSSVGEPATQLAGALSYGNDLVFTNGQQGGEMKFYQFNVPAGIASVEVRLENRVGNPVMLLNQGLALAGSADNYPYGNFGGTNDPWSNGSLITIPNPQPGAFSLSVYAADDGTGTYPDANYVLRVRAPVLPPLSFSAELNSGSLSNIAAGTLADTEHAYYQVIVPGAVNGAPVLGWQLELTALAGSPSVRVRQNLLPDNTCDSTSFASPDAIIAPPYLAPGTWYVDVVGGGSTTYTLTSRVITTNTLAHAVWTMPAVGQTNTAPGLALPFIGDSGVDTNGNPLPGDQGIDLKQGGYDYYAVTVPTNNANLLRTELQAISGNPNLYIRVGAAPTLNHYAAGSCDWWDGQLLDRQLTGGTTEYGNWVPLNGRYAAQLTPGLWVLAVQAGGNANARYRLQLACGNSVSNGVVQDLALNGGGFTNQNLNGGDWRYYRVQIPDPAPTNWVVTFSRSLGSARLFVRDTSPPGDGQNPADFSSSSYNPGPGSTDLQSWNSDGKNEGPYPRFDTPGICTLTTPPLRPGSTYYLGFWSPVDTTFSVSSVTNGGTINVTNDLAFYGGAINTSIPGYGTLLYRIDVPPTATRILLNASNSVNVVLALEQGTIAQAGGPAHWTSYQNNNSQNPNQANASFDQMLNTPNNWPWLPGYSYYLTLTNTSPAAENTSFMMSVPGDLIPVSFTAPASVTATRPNPSIQVAWGEKNLGPAVLTGSWYDAVWFSTNGVWDANSVNIGYFWVYNQTLPVGGSYWQTNTVTLPMSGSGNYTLFVQVDAGNSLYEANLGDKLSTPAAGTFTLTPPDLKPVWVVAPATVTAANPNPAVQVAWGVTNQGVGLASGGWYDRVWFSTNGVLDSSSIDAGDFYFSPGVPAGGAYTQTNLVTLPVSLGGTYNYALFVQVDIYNWIYESNKANNVSAPVPGTLTLDLPPQIVTQPLNQLVAPGTNVTLSVVANGTPPLHYQWQYNNSRLSGATNPTLVFNNVQPTNSGNYLVVVTNAFGAATSTTASLLVAAPGTNCTPAPAGLVGWWPGEGNANDVIGANNGTLQNGAGFAPGQVGQAFSFSGANSYVSIATTGSLAGTFTLEFWVLPTSLNGTLGLVGSRTPQDGSYDLQLTGSGLHQDIGNGNWWLTTSADAAYAFVPGHWYHIASVVTPTNYTLLINGTVAGGGSYGAGTPLLFDANHQLQIGAIGCCGEYMNGLIDEVSVYNRALSFDEVAAIYLAGAQGKCPSVPPAILVQPQSQASLAGSNVVFSVSAVGEQPLSYHWQRNGVNLTDAGNISGSTNPSLIISNVSSADAGTYAVVVSNAVASVTSTGAMLSVNVLQNGGFESGNWNDWTLSGNTGGMYLSGSSAYDHSGGYGVEAGPGGSLGYLSQTIPTQPGTAYMVSFWLDSQGGTPNEFLVSWNGTKLFDQVNLGVTGWTNMQFVASATSNTTVLTFGFRNDPSYFGLDDISVGALAAAPPPLRLASAGFSTNGACQLAVYGQSGQAYTLQASTNLVNWVSILNFTCTNSPAYVADPGAKSYRRRFYRVAQGTLPVPASPMVLGFGSPQPWTANGLSLQLQGQAGYNYQILASTDLVSWLPITNFANANPPLYFNDAQAQNYHRRFYRAVTVP